MKVGSACVRVCASLCAGGNMRLLFPRADNCVHARACVCAPECARAEICVSRSRERADDCVHARACTPLSAREYIPTPPESREYPPEYQPSSPRVPPRVPLEYPGSIPRAPLVPRRVPPQHPYGTPSYPFVPL
jgi:hypothetical protein